MSNKRDNVHKENSLPPDSTSACFTESLILSGKLSQLTAIDFRVLINITYLAPQWESEDTGELYQPYPVRFRFVDAKRLCSRMSYNLSIHRLVGLGILIPSEDPSRKNGLPERFWLGFMPNPTNY